MDDRTNTKGKRTTETKIILGFRGAIYATEKEKQKMQVKTDCSKEIRKKPLEGISCFMGKEGSLSYLALVNTKRIWLT